MDTWTWPQWTMAILMTLKLMTHASKHGKPLKCDYSFPMAIMTAFISAFILWKGGFWK